MKAATVKQIKDELGNRSPKEMLEICLHLSKFKKENKELLTYLLFEASDESSYIESVKEEMEEGLEQINRKSFFFIKKGIRKVLANVKKHIRYSKNKETEVELLISFCEKLKEFKPSINRSTTMKNLYDRQVGMIEKKLSSLHEDLQYDYSARLEEL